MKNLLFALFSMALVVSACQKCPEVCGNCYEVTIHEKKLNGTVDADTVLLGHYCDQEYCDIDGYQEPYSIGGMIERYCVED